MWKVYKHTSPSNKIYIGITSKENPNDRWKNGKGYPKSQKLFYRAIEKYGWDNFEHEILFDNLTEEEAKQKEIELIEFYNSSNKEYGYNLSNGGDAFFKGRKHTQETKNKISTVLKEKEFHKGKDNPMYGVPSKYKGVPRSEEVKRKLSMIQKENYARNGLNKNLLNYIETQKKKVNQYDLDGNFIKTFDSIKDASVELTGSIRAVSNISSVCKRKKTTNGAIIRSYKGYQWRYFDDCDDIRPYYINKANHSSQSKKIEEIDSQGNIIGTYNSIGECAKILKLNDSSISQVCKGNYKTTKGHMFRYAENNDN